MRSKEALQKALRGRAWKSYILHMDKRDKNCPKKWISCVHGAITCIRYKSRDVYRSCTPHNRS